MSLGPLAQLCRRLAASYAAGIDPRATWRREAAAARGEAADRLAAVADELDSGTALEDALRSTRPLFPKTFYELVAVGEESGRSPEVFERLADHYDQLLAMRRAFALRMSWPLIQLVGAVGVIAVFILVLGFIPDAPDPLGWGTGVAGLAKFGAAIAAVLALIYVAYVALARGLAPHRPLHRLVLAIPYAGGAVRTLAVSVIAAVLELTLASGMEIRRAVDLALRAARLAPFADAAAAVRARLTAGDELHVALAQHDEFPRDFIDAVAVGEQAGRLPEQMTVIARLYRERAYAALAILAQVVAFLLWGLIVAVIIFGFMAPLVRSIIQPYQDALDFLNESQGGR